MILAILIFLLFIIAGISTIFFLYNKEKYERIRYSKNNVLDYDIDKNGLVNVYSENDDEDDLRFINYDHDHVGKYTPSNYIRHNRQRNNYNRNIHSNVIY